MATTDLDKEETVIRDMGAIAARSAAQLPTVARSEPRDDVDQALRDVTAAAAAYITAFPAGSSALVHAAR